MDNLQQIIRKGWCVPSNALFTSRRQVMLDSIQIDLEADFSKIKEWEGGRVKVTCASGSYFGILKHGVEYGPDWVSFNIIGDAMSHPFRYDPETIKTLEEDGFCSDEIELLDTGIFPELFCEMEKLYCGVISLKSTLEEQGNLLKALSSIASIILKHKVTVICSSEKGKILEIE